MIKKPNASPSTPEDGPSQVFFPLVGGFDFENREPVEEIPADDPLNAELRRIDAFFVDAARRNNPDDEKVYK